MLNDRIESGWIAAFAEVFELCRMRRGESIVILGETQSRALNLHLAELALGQLGLPHAQLCLPTPASAAGPIIRSSGASQALNGQDWAVKALAQAACQNCAAAIASPQSALHSVTLPSSQSTSTCTHTPLSLCSLTLPPLELPSA